MMLPYTFLTNIEYNILLLRCECFFIHGVYFAFAVDDCQVLFLLLSNTGLFYSYCCMFFLMVNNCFDLKMKRYIHRYVRSAALMVYGFVGLMYFLCAVLYKKEYSFRELLASAGKFFSCLTALVFTGAFLYRSFPFAKMAINNIPIPGVLPMLLF
jgi:hypothetical protein